MQRKRKIPTLLAAAFSLVLLTGCDVHADLDFGGTKHTETFDWSGRLAAGQTVEIKGVNGSIRAYEASGDQVEVLATKSSRRDNLSEVRIEVVEHADGVTLCAVYPGRGNSCEPGNAGSIKAKRNRIAVEFEVAVPAGIQFVGKTVNGSVKARGLTAAAWARTTNGSVHLETSGYGSAETVNGSVKATLGATSFPEGLDFSTVNGSVTLYLPTDINASVKASTTNGRVRSDFDLDIPKRRNGGRATGDLGNGGELLQVKTVNGSVKILEAGAAD